MIADTTNTPRHVAVSAWRLQQSLRCRPRECYGSARVACPFSVCPARSTSPEFSLTYRVSERRASCIHIFPRSHFGAFSVTDSDVIYTSSFAPVSALVSTNSSVIINNCIYEPSIAPIACVKLIKKNTNKKWLT